ncbi:hypothetical protein [Sorangium sp. So ce388]|uniref:hypothetical protein n=1 Tax=Sorangium sp. So ce388 TaxID=3133309 RepID=UPI003F5B6CE1
MRNGSMAMGYTLLPGQAGRFRPGFEAMLVTGIGRPVGETPPGAHYLLGTAASLILPTYMRDLRPGYAIGGLAWETVLEWRNSMWFPPAGADRAVTLDSSVGVALRLRFFTDIVSGNGAGYPTPWRSQ